MHIAGLEEDFLKQREKLHWLDVGDQNNMTCHQNETSSKYYSGNQMYGW